jgi:hypothetical protein
MTEEEWLNELSHSQGMLGYLRTTSNVARTKAGKRKLRLFACGCCRIIWEHFHDSRLRDVVDVAERFAEGRATKEELSTAFNSVLGLTMGAYLPDTPEVRSRTVAHMALSTTTVRAIGAAFDMTALPLPLAGYRGGEVGGNASLCKLLRCVFGNPFRPGDVNPSWLTWNEGTVVHLAQAIYYERAFDRLPILADALEDVGCDNADILRHCREPGEHVRGCWVVDLLLGKP